MRPKTIRQNRPNVKDSFDTIGSMGKARAPGPETGIWEKALDTAVDNSVLWDAEYTGAFSKSGAVAVRSTVCEVERSYQFVC